MAGSVIVDQLPQGVPAERGPDAGPQQPPPISDEQPGDEAKRRRRRLLVLLGLLGLLVLSFIAVVLWYLIFRQPLPLPIPPAPQDQAPAYSFSIYDLSKPLSVAVSPDGNRIYVTQGEGTQETVMLDGRGNRLGVLNPPANLTAHATQLFVAVDPVTAEVYASDRMAGQVYIYAADGTYLRRFSPGGALAGWQPLALAFDARGDLFVSDAGGSTQRIHEFGRDGKLIHDFGEPGQLNFPNGLAVDRDGNLYVSNTNDGQLVVFGPSGTRVGLIERGPGSGELGLPVGVAVDSQRRVFVVDSSSQAVQIYGAMKSGDDAPGYLTSFGSEGTADGAFEYPNGIAVDAHGRVYVADWNNGRVQVWSY